MRHLTGAVVKLLGSLFGLLVLCFTGYQTWSLIFEITKDAIVATIGLVLFEGGTLYWWSIFKQDAKGIMQMALSLLLFVFGLLLMVGSNALHLGAVDATFLGPQTPQRLILVAAIISLIGKLVYPLLSPEMTQDIWQRALQGMLVLKALMKTEARLEEHAQRIADTMSGAMATKVEMDLFTQYLIPHNLFSPTNLPALSAPQPTTVNAGNDDPAVIDLKPNESRGRAQPEAADPVAPGFWQSFLNWALGKQPQSEPVTANNRQPVEAPQRPRSNGNEDEQPVPGASPTPPRPARFKVEAKDTNTGGVIHVATADSPAAFKQAVRKCMENWPYARKEMYENELIEGEWIYMPRQVIQAEPLPVLREYEIEELKEGGWKRRSRYTSLPDAQEAYRRIFAQDGYQLRITHKGQVLEELGKPALQETKPAGNDNLNPWLNGLAQGQDVSHLSPQQLREYMEEAYEVLNRPTPAQ